MSTSRVAELKEKLDSLPLDQREKIAGYISEHFEDIDDEMKWDDAFQRTSDKLAEFVKDARNQIDEGIAEDMDFDRL